MSDSLRGAAQGREGKVSPLDDGREGARARRPAQDGWYEAEVIEAKGAGIYTLRWRDWPELPILVRRREHMALLHPNTAAVEAA